MPENLDEIISNMAHVMDIRVLQMIVDIFEKERVYFQSYHVIGYPVDSHNVEFHLIVDYHPDYYCKYLVVSNGHVICMPVKHVDPNLIEKAPILFSKLNWIIMILRGSSERQVMRELASYRMGLSSDKSLIPLQKFIEYEHIFINTLEARRILES